MYCSVCVYFTTDRDSLVCIVVIHVCICMCVDSTCVVLCGGIFHLATPCSEVTTCMDTTLYSYVIHTTPSTHHMHVVLHTTPSTHHMHVVLHTTPSTHHMHVNASSECIKCMKIRLFLLTTCTTIIIIAKEMCSNP